MEPCSRNSTRRRSDLLNRFNCRMYVAETKPLIVYYLHRVLGSYQPSNQRLGAKMHCEWCIEDTFVVLTFPLRVDSTLFAISPPSTRSPLLQRSRKSSELIRVNPWPKKLHLRRPVKLPIHGGVTHDGLHVFARFGEWDGFYELGRIAVRALAHPFFDAVRSGVVGGEGVLE